VRIDVYALEYSSTPCHFISTGNNRFRQPVPIPEYTTSFDASTMGPACPQQAITLPLPDGIPTDIVSSIVSGAVFTDDEDCE